VYIHNFTVSPEKKGLNKFLGDLETEIMELIWEENPLSVRQATELLNLNRKLAYTTVLTVMSRLADKDFLVRQKTRSGLLFSPALTRQQFTSEAVKQVLGELMKNFPEELNSALTSANAQLSVPEFRGENSRPTSKKSGPK